MNSEICKRILFLSANPINTLQLRLGEEIREIENELKKTKFRDNFRLFSKHALRPKDLIESLIDIKPNIVHFSGHGAAEDGIILENDYGKPHLLSSDTLEDLLEIFKDNIEIVILNACFSEIQAKAISKYISYVIGIKNAVKDKAAIKFSCIFYYSLGTGEGVEKAFQIASSAVKAFNIPGNHMPVLIKNEEYEKHFSDIIDKPANEKGGNFKALRDLYHEKLFRLKKAYAIETEPASKFKLEVQIEEAEKELNTICSQFNDFI